MPQSGGGKGLPGARGALALKAAAARPPPLVGSWRRCSGLAGGRQRRLHRASKESRSRRRPQATRKVPRRASAKRSVWNDSCLPLNPSAVQVQPEAAQKGGHFHARVNTQTKVQKTTRFSTTSHFLSHVRWTAGAYDSTTAGPRWRREVRRSAARAQLFPTAGSAARSGPWRTTYPELRPARL